MAPKNLTDLKQSISDTCLRQRNLSVAKAQFRTALEEYTCINDMNRPPATMLRIIAMAKTTAELADMASAIIIET